MGGLSLGNNTSYLILRTLKYTLLDLERLLWALNSLLDLVIYAYSRWE